MIDKFFCKELFKSLSFSYQRLFIIALSIFIGAMVSSAFLNIYFDIDTKLSKELKAYGANVIITPIKNEFITNKDIDTIKNKLHARAFSPFLFSLLNLGSTSGVVVGTDFKALKITKPFLELKEGSFSLKDFCDSCAFVGKDLAKSLQSKVNQELYIYNPHNNKSTKVTIKAILSSNDEFDSLLIMPLELLQNLNELYSVHYANAVLDGSYEEIKSKTNKLSNEFINLKPISSVSLSEALVLDKIKALMFLIILIILLIISTSLNTTLSTIIFARKKELALRLALGSTKNQVLKLFMGEYLIISFLASVLGVICGIFLANLFGYIIFDAFIEFRFLALLLAFLISLVFSMFASILPLKNALKINICKNLKAE